MLNLCCHLFNKKPGLATLFRGLSGRLQRVGFRSLLTVERYDQLQENWKQRLEPPAPYPPLFADTGQSNRRLFRIEAPSTSIEFTRAQKQKCDGFVLHSLDAELDASLTMIHRKMIFNFFVRRYPNNTQILSHTSSVVGKFPGWPVYERYLVARLLAKINRKRLDT